MGTFIKKLEEHDGEKEGGVTITVSGLAGSGKTTIAKIISEETGLKYVSAGKIFRQMAEEKGVSLEEFSATRKPETDLEIDKRTLNLARKGGVVLDGRITGWVAGTHAQVKILTKAEDEEVAKRVAKRDDKTVKQALRDVKKRNESDLKAYQETYGVDATDQSIYNFVIDNTFPAYEEIKKLSHQLGKIINTRFQKP